jgi:hypothetical protein
VQHQENATTTSKSPSRSVSPPQTHATSSTDDGKGMKLHLYTILPAALLVILQFIPLIRHKLLIFHRMNGYIILLLSLISNAGTIIICSHAFGGDFSTQTWTGAMVLLTTAGYTMAWINIKLLQIDQHRAWMLRTWAWVYFPSMSKKLGLLLTEREVYYYHHYSHYYDYFRSGYKFASRLVCFHPLPHTTPLHTISDNHRYTIRPCAQIAFTLGENATLATYPQCVSYFNGQKPDLHVIVTADFSSSNSVELSAALGIPFGAAGWLALLIHTFAMECYVSPTHPHPVSPTSKISN